jgi:hypothetical protein
MVRKCYVCNGEKQWGASDVGIVGWVICSAFCFDVFHRHMKKPGTLSLYEAWQKARKEAELADTLIKEMVAQDTSS